MIAKEGVVLEEGGATVTNSVAVSDEKTVVVVSSKKEVGDAAKGRDGVSGIEGRTDGEMDVS